MARAFGAGPRMDTYVFAMGIYTFVAAWLSTSVAPAIIPSITLLNERQGRMAAHQAFRAAARAALLFLGTGAFALFAASPIVPLLAGRLAEGQAELAISSLRILAPILVFSAFAQTWELLLIATGAPVRAALIPLVRPLVVVIGLASFPRVRIEALPWLQMGAYALEAALAAVVLRARGWPVMPKWNPLHPPVDLGAARRQYIAITATSLLASVSPLADQIVTARLLRGGVATLAYGQRLTAPLLIVAVALTNSFFFPRALRHVASGDSRGLLRMVDRLLIRAFLVSALATSVLIVLAEPIVRLAYLRNSFTEADVPAVVTVMRVAALHVPWAVIGNIVARAMIAHNASHRLVVGAALTPIINLCFDIVLARRMGLAGIAMSSVIVHAYAFAYTYLAFRERSKRFT